MNPPNLREYWAGLRQRLPERDVSGYRLQFISSWEEIRVYAAVAGADLHAVVLIEIPERVPPKPLTSASGRVFEVKVAAFPGFAVGHYGVGIELHDVSYEDLFERLAQDVIEAVRQSASAARTTGAIAGCIERWRAFIERSHRPMSDDEVRGLVGELVVLGRCIGRLGAREALATWEGPSGALRDFRLPETSVEAKTFEADTGAALRFNDPQQLDADDARPVHIAAVRLAKRRADGMTLPEMVEHLQQVLAYIPETVEIFAERLARYGYVAEFADRLDQRFVAGPLVLYHVREGFPRIRAADVPLGVEGVHFSVALAGLRPFMVDAAAVLGPPDEQLERQE